MRFYTNFHYLLVYFNVVWLLLFRDKVNTILQILLVFLFNWHQLRKKYIQLRIQTGFDGIKKGRELLLIFSVYYVHFFFIRPNFMWVMFCFFNNFFSLRIILNLDWPSKGHYNLFFCWEKSVIKFCFACFIYLFFGGRSHFILHILTVSVVWILFHTSHALYSCFAHSPSAWASDSAQKISGVETGTQSFHTDDWGKSPEKCYCCET